MQEKIERIKNKLRGYKSSGFAALMIDYVYFNNTWCVCARNAMNDNLKACKDKDLNTALNMFESMIDEVKNEKNLS